MRFRRKVTPPPAPPKDVPYEPPTYKLELAEYRPEVVFFSYDASRRFTMSYRVRELDIFGLAHDEDEAIRLARKAVKAALKPRLDIVRPIIKDVRPL